MGKQECNFSPEGGMEPMLIQVPDLGVSLRDFIDRAVSAEWIFPFTERLKELLIARIEREQGVRIISAIIPDRAKLPFPRIHRFDEETIIEFLTRDGLIDRNRTLHFQVGDILIPSLAEENIEAVVAFFLEEEYIDSLILLTEALQTEFDAKYPDGVPSATPPTQEEIDDMLVELFGSGFLTLWLPNRKDDGDVSLN